MDDRVELLIDRFDGLPADVRKHALEVLIGHVAGQSRSALKTIRHLLTELESDPSLSVGIGLDYLEGRVSLEAGLLSPSVSAGIDVLILTVKPVELDACLNAFGVTVHAKPVVLSNSGICTWIIDTKIARVAVAMVGTAGNVETAAFLNSIDRDLPFRSAILVGMCAGVKGKMTLGSVIVAELVHAYEFVKMEATGPKYEPKPRPPAESDIRSVELVNRVDKFWPGVVAAVQARNDPFPENEAETIEKWKPFLKRGGLLAGGWLIEDGSLPAFSYQFSSDIRGAEMEGAGFATACGELGKPWVVLRGVADYGEEGRRKHWQWPATFAAASAARKCITEKLILHRVLDKRE
jgi:nucleoside phosphorylase